MQIDKINKRGEVGDQVMLIIFIFLLVLISVGVVSGVLIFFGSEYDFRQVGAEVLNYNIRNCLDKEGIDSSFFSNLYERCGLNEGIINSSYIVKICENSQDCIMEQNYKFSHGDAVQCGLTGAFGNINYPKCSIREITIQGVTYTIIIGSKQARRISNE